MDRRQRKSREAIFRAFTQLLSEKKLSQITVGQIIEAADVGRATFYAHFETKDYLLKAFCQELFCHIFDAAHQEHTHRHIFQCQGSDSVFLLLFSHIFRNDNNLLTLLSCQNNEVFWSTSKKISPRLSQTSCRSLMSGEIPICPRVFGRSISLPASL